MTKLKNKKKTRKSFLQDYAKLLKISSKVKEEPVTIIKGDKSLIRKLKKFHIPIKGEIK